MPSYYKIIVVSSLVSLTLWGQLNAPTATTSNAQTISPTPTSTQPLKRAATSSFPEILNKIAFCESGGRQFDSSGNVIRGKQNPDDIGKYQINTYYHLEDAKKLGYDLYTLEGNTAYALHLYRTQGTRPWTWSSKCWNS